MINTVLFSGRTQIIGSPKLIADTKARLAEHEIVAEEVAPHDGLKRPKLCVLMTGTDFETYQAFDREHDQLLDKNWGQRQIPDLLKRMTEFILRPDNVVEAKPRQKRLTDDQFAKVVAALKA